MINYFRLPYIRPISYSLASWAHRNAGHFHCKAVALWWISCRYMVTTPSLILFLPQIHTTHGDRNRIRKSIRMCVVYCCINRRRMHANEVLLRFPVPWPPLLHIYDYTVNSKQEKCLYQFLFFGFLKFHLGWCRHAVIVPICLVQRRVYSRTHIISRSAWIR